MGNEQSHQPSSLPYVLARVTEAILPRTDNYILNQIGDWAAQQTRPALPCVRDTTDVAMEENGFIDVDGEDDDVQVVGEDPPPTKPVRRQWDSFDLMSRKDNSVLATAVDANDSCTHRRSPKSFPSAKERSRFAPYHKPPNQANMDRGTYLEFLRRKMPNIYKNQAVTFKKAVVRRYSTSKESSNVSCTQSTLKNVPISSLLGYSAKKTLATQTETDPIVIEDSAPSSPAATGKSSPPSKLASGSDSWLKQFQKELDRIELDRNREVVIQQKLLADIVDNRKKLQAKIGQSTAVDLPPQSVKLTHDMVMQIEKGLAISDHNRLLVEEFKLPITRGDLHKLEGLNWLNDSIINFYFAMLVDRSEKNENLPKVYSFSTFFYERLRNEGYKAVKRWTKRVDVFSKEILLVPVHLGMHWCLAVIDFQKKSIEYYDSMGGDNDDCLNALYLWIQEESLDKRKTTLNMEDWTLVNRKDIPQQHNGSDCGMFACRFAEYVTRRAKINFTQKDMAYFRKRTMYEILEKRLL